MWPLLLSLISTVSSNTGQQDEENQSKAENARKSDYDFDAYQFEKKAENKGLDEQKRSALSRALKAKDNELPNQLNSQMYPKFQPKAVTRSPWDTLGGATKAAGGINWNKLFGDYSGANSALNPGSDSPASYAGPDSGSYSDVG